MSIQIVILDSVLVLFKKQLIIFHENLILSTNFNVMLNKKFLEQNGRKILLKDQGNIFQIDMKNITVITCEGYLSTVHFLSDLKPISVSKLLKKFENELEPFGFFRVNRNALINLRNVVLFQGACKRIITLADNQKIFVSFRKTCQLKRILSTF